MDLLQYGSLSRVDNRGNGRSGFLRPAPTDVRAPHGCRDRKGAFEGSTASMKALQVRIRKVKKSDIDRIIDIERSWHHLSHWSIDSYYRLLNDDGFTSSFVAEAEDEAGQFRIIGFVIFHMVSGVSEIYNIAVE